MYIHKYSQRSRWVQMSKQFDNFVRLFLIDMGAPIESTVLTGVKISGRCKYRLVKKKVRLYIDRNPRPDAGR